MTEKTDIFVNEVQEAVENIIAFWTKNMQDPRGGYYGRMTADGKPDTEAPKGVVLNARILWALSAAYRVRKNQDYLLAATKAKDYFIEKFFDHKHGGVYWTLNPASERLDVRKQSYAQAFGIYAISEYVRATKDQSAVRFAQNLFLTIEKNLKDLENGGYVEGRSRDWSEEFDARATENPGYAKSSNTHLHLLEAYTNLYRVWPDKRLRQSIIDLLNIFTDKIYNAETGHLNLYFEKDWKATDSTCNFGHEASASWVLLEAAFKVGDIDLINKVRPVAKAAMYGALSGYQPDGSIISEYRADGSIDTDRYWWAQAENVIANLWCWKYEDDPKAAQRALREWDYIKNHIIDAAGCWRMRCNAQGEANMEDDLAGLYKGPYHNTRMCSEVLHILRHQAL